ncbi:hypothetical protein AGABI2DRAFT_63000 [Agaricus bisporus var. bisporus H97]|uniref:hypothetical protein n=1 Tax=Agaricus bisporus var. bisporus (strain H97 / ATCC MYA-4626 / FGSC 10389) TaxID=936046 RepID=UPI00029F7FB2|nr:hypothetical protein AGABI2DRAFT_63000 [Agaricus bisporus var. bisporus H97]EKV50888.1 hypothetical protein AGABI2DRAFT_63000 [Agaricus bisporus var. bisporus H97]
MHSTSFTTPIVAVQATDSQCKLSTSSISHSDATFSGCPVDSESSPQCCHCGWRGTHAPDCPFR